MTHTHLCVCVCVSEGQFGHSPQAERGWQTGGGRTLTTWALTERAVPLPVYCRLLACQGERSYGRCSGWQSIMGNDSEKLRWSPAILLPVFWNVETGRSERKRKWSLLLTLYQGQRSNCSISRRPWRRRTLTQGKVRSQLDKRWLHVIPQAANG